MTKPLTIVLLLCCIQVYAQNIDVPIDYQNPQLGSFKLDYEFGLPYDPNLPTVIVIADAQQFYVRKGSVNKIQNTLFGNNVNVLGILPRSNNEDLKQKINLTQGDQVNWNLSYTVFNSYQFSSDIEKVINEVLEDENVIYLYGQSGGAFLITEYLSIFPKSRVDKVFIAASVNPVIENKLGINHDSFQRDFISDNPASKAKLATVLNNGFFKRELVSSLFQRQNFFVELDSLNKSRVTLTEQLYQKDTISINQKKEAYQIDAINNFLNSEAGIPIRVRLFEFIKPLLSNWDRDLSFYPDLENSYNIAQPLIENNAINKLGYHPNFDENSFREFKGEVFILAARYDHIADYRSSIYLSALLKKCHLFVVDDDHTFKQLKSDSSYSKLIQDYFFSDDISDWIHNYKPYRWIEE